MEQVGPDFSFNGVAWTSIAQACIRICTLALWVTTLHHELTDDAMKNQTVVKLFVDKFEKVVAC